MNFSFHAPVTYGISSQLAAMSNVESMTPMERRLEIRKRILSLQDWLSELPQLDSPLKHHFAPGMYGREMFIEQGALVVGKIHSHEHLNVVSKGKVLVLTEFGLEEITAPATFVSKVGTKRVVYAQEDTVWTTIHANPSNTTDLDELESEIITKSYNELDLDGKLFISNATGDL